MGSPPGAAGASPPSPPGGQSAGGQPPFGQTGGATTATPNRGYEAAALQRVGVILKQLEQLVPQLGSTSEHGKIIMDVIGKLAKLVPAGSVTPAAMKNNVESLALQNASQNQQMQALRQQQGGKAA